MPRSRSTQSLPPLASLPSPRSFVIAFALLLALKATGHAQQAVGTAADSTAFYRALDAEGAGKYREAAALFRQALRSKVAVSALLGLERAYAELQWTDSLLPPLDTLIRQNPREPIFRAVQLRTLQTLNRERDVDAAFERWVRDVPRDPAPYREYSRLLLQKGQ